jgi:outer membrane cobalamin receptor
MRPPRRLFLILIASLAAHAADLKIKVVDPRSAVVASAQVSLYQATGSQPLGLQNSSAEGIAVFSGLEAGEYRVEVFAPGFAPLKVAVQVPQQAGVTAQLAVAGPAQTVVVTATRTPLPAEESGAAVISLDKLALENMQPVAANEALRFLPGAVVNTAGQRGNLASLFVRGGESRYNKVLVDGVPVNEPGGTFDFGVVPLAEVERVEFVRGPASVLYGSDAMTSVVQMWSATGHTRVPEFRFGAEGGTFSSASGFASVAGARGRFDYSLFGQQQNSEGQGVNDAYSNSSQGANLGVLISRRASFRLRARHANSRAGVQNEWNFNGQPLLPPDSDGFTRQNNLLASAELDLAAPVRWQHRLLGFEYRHTRLDQDGLPIVSPGPVSDRGCDPTNFNFLDCFFASPFAINRAGFEYQGNYSPRNWARTTFGYQFEDENGASDSQFLTADFSPFPLPPVLFIGTSHTRGVRLNHSLYAEEAIIRGRISLLAGVRYIHTENFGETSPTAPPIPQVPINKAVPQVALSLLALRGGDFFSGTRLRFAYSEGIKEPRFEETFGISGSFPANPNPDLQPEQNRSLEAGVQQSLWGGQSWLTATYFNNLFRNLIAFQSDPLTFIGQYFNVNRSLAHGAEVEFHSRLRSSLALDAAYVYTSTQILSAPGASSPNATGEPLLRRPKHSGSLLLNYFGKRWGGDLAGSFVGRRPDSDFLFGLVPPQDHAAGYARVDVGGWFAVNRHMTAYVNVENVLNRRYNEVVGYPALKANFRAGMRFRIGGE